MTQLPAALPGMAPLPGIGQALPGSTPTPHDPAAADPFLALLSQLVGPAATPITDPVATPPTAPGATPGAAPAALPIEVSAEADAESTGEPTAEPADASLETDAPTFPTLAGLPQLAPITPPTQVAQLNQAAAVVAPQPAPASRTQSPSQPAPPAAAPVAGPELVAARTGATSAPTREAPAPPPAPTSAPTPAPTSALTVAVAAAVPSAATTAAAPVGTDAPAPVARQVFPEVVRVASTGETPRRVVVRLDPEHLGEVRVVLRTDRSGALEVSLAGGPEARAAIREGAPELRRMLEAAGSHDPKVLVRHLADPAQASAPAPATPTTSARTDVPTTAGGLPVDVGAGTAGGTAHGDERQGRTPQDAHPGAMDGIPDRLVESTRQAERRATGLDVMM